MTLVAFAKHFRYGYAMWKIFKNLFVKKNQEQNEKAPRLSREELLVKSARGSAMAIKRYHGALDKLAEHDRQAN